VPLQNLEKAVKTNLSTFAIASSISPPDMLFHHGSCGFSYAQDSSFFAGLFLRCGFLFVAGFALCWVFFFAVVLRLLWSFSLQQFSLSSSFFLLALFS